MLKFSFGILLLNPLLSNIFYCICSLACYIYQICSLVMVSPKSAMKHQQWMKIQCIKERKLITVTIPMGGVANVCRPTIWAGPSPSRKSLNWLSGPRRVVGKTKLQFRGNWEKNVCSNMNDKAPSCRMDTHVPSELFELVLPSVESLLPCRVTRFLISTAMPVSVLRRMVLRSFLVPPSAKHRSQHFFFPIYLSKIIHEKRDQ